jgi:hypothetical protein
MPKKNVSKELSPTIQAVLLVGKMAKRPCEWAAPMFNPCGIARVKSGGKAPGVSGCLTCEARFVHKKAMDKFAAGFEAFTLKPLAPKDR